jgi:light-regulated signal transduction histidine kinase (bacteriophytochrome)
MHYLARLITACRRMNDLIDALLKLSRINSQGLKPEFVNLSAVAQETFNAMNELNESRIVNFKCEESIMVHGDATLMKSVMENLIGNALKYSANRECTKIEFGTARFDKDIVYYVRDNGAGFDMAYADDLFAPFRRLHSDEEFTGIGIGLATVQRIIRRHGGRIWAEGEKGKGATFYFTLGGVLPEI